MMHAATQTSAWYKTIPASFVTCVQLLTAMGARWLLYKLTARQSAALCVTTFHKILCEPQTMVDSQTCT